MVLQTQLKAETLSLDDFNVFIERPENTDKLFEFINGEIVEVPSNAYVSKIAARIIIFIGIYLLEHDIGHITGEGGGYMISGERYAPDVAFISYARQPELAHKGYNPNPPELAVEVISDPSNKEEQRQLRLKLSSYQAAGVTTWIVNAEDVRVEIHRPGEKAIELDIRGVLTAEDILPGFELPVKDIFPNTQIINPDDTESE